MAYRPKSIQNCRSGAWRPFCFALLALVLQHGFAQSQAFQSHIDRWVAQDALHTPPEGSILFTGSSSIRRWEQLTRDFADYKVIQRGFGGSQFEHLIGFAGQILLPYRPAAIVVWEGTNDIKSGETGAEVFADYKQFVSLVHDPNTGQPGVPIFYVGIMPTPGRFDCCEAENTIANNAIKKFAATNANLHYIDLPAAFYALDPPGGAEFKALFVDSIHLNRAGYDLWTTVIRPQIEAVIRPNKAPASNPKTPGPGGRLLFDFGPSNPEDGDPTSGSDANGRIWNNWHPAEGDVAVNAGEHISNLVDDRGKATGIRLTITGGFATNGKLQGGLLAPDASLLGELAIATATQDYFYCSADGKKGGGNDDRAGGFMLDGLDPDLAYTFRFFGSRAAEQQPHTTEYALFGANQGSAKLQTSGLNLGAEGASDGNNNKLATVANIRPDKFGQIFVDLTVVEGLFAYLNALEITIAAP